MSVERPRAIAGADDLSGRRISSVIRIAGEHRTGLSVEALWDLLPSAGPPTPADVSRWISEHPSNGSLREGRAFDPALSTPAARLEDRIARGRRYLAHARALSEGALAGVRPLLRTLSVTGSTAYGEPEPGDDLDFLAVTRDGSLWLVLAFTYLRLRVGARLAGRADDGTPCFNFVIEDREARREFARENGLLFARESLMAQPIEGTAHYRALVGSAPWMAAELPRLYARWSAEGFPSLDEGAPAPWPVRLANLLVYPWLAAYLQLQGLYRNRRFRRAGRPERSFRTVTRLRRMCFASARFDRLRAEYALVSTVPSGAV
jgi:hypothetical protein